MRIHGIQKNVKMSVSVPPHLKSSSKRRRWILYHGSNTMTMLPVHTFGRLLIHNKSLPFMETLRYIVLSMIRLKMTLSHPWRVFPFRSHHNNIVVVVCKQQLLMEYQHPRLPWHRVLPFLA